MEYRCTLGVALRNEMSAMRALAASVTRVYTGKFMYK